MAPRSAEMGRSLIALFIHNMTEIKWENVDLTNEIGVEICNPK
jgi:hypothetical protein